MNMMPIDWIVVLCALALLYAVSYVVKKYMVGVSDFLVAGRSVGRYLGMGSGSMAGLGAITILAIWQMGYKSGFVGNWLWSYQFPFAILLGLTGFGVFRFRRTRAMTIPQLIEMRYSRKLRILCGLTTYVSGVLNMGIFPIAGANFIVFFCGLPTHVDLLGISCPTVLLIMIILVGISVLICLTGGQVALIITDFLQGVFVSVILFGFVIIVYKTMRWSHFVEAYQIMDGSRALVDPFVRSGSSDFGLGFFLIQIFWMFYLIVAWSPDTMQVSSAKDAKEAKLMRSLLQFKYLIGASMGLFVLPLAAYVIMHHNDFADMAAKANFILQDVDNPYLRSQLIVPAAVAQIIPPGFLGAFVAVIVFAFIATHQTYLLAWGGTLIQDVVIPLKNKPLSLKSHLLLLRLSVVVVAVFIIIFSMYFKMTDGIFMFMALTGAVYTSGAGIVILGALYWPRATTKGAWTAMIAGTALSLFGFIYRYKINPEFPLNGTQIAFGTSILSSIIFFLVSLLDRHSTKFNLDTLLNKYDDGMQKKNAKWWKWASGFNRGDKGLFWFMFCYTFAYLMVPVILCIVRIFYNLDQNFWFQFWKYYLYSMFISGSLFTIWVVFGGFKDMFAMLNILKHEKHNIRDDGSVQKTESLK